MNEEVSQFIVEFLEELTSNESTKSDCLTQTRIFPKVLSKLINNFTGGARWLPLAGQTIEVSPDDEPCPLGKLIWENSWLDKRVSNLDGKSLPEKLEQLCNRRYALLEIVGANSLYFEVPGWVMIQEDDNSFHFLTKSRPFKITNEKWRYLLHIGSDDWYFGDILNYLYEDYSLVPCALTQEILRVSIPDLEPFLSNSGQRERVRKSGNSRIGESSDPIELGYDLLDARTYNYTKNVRVGKYSKKRKNFLKWKKKAEHRNRVYQRRRGGGRRRRKKNKRVHKKRKVKMGKF